MAQEGSAKRERSRLVEPEPRMTSRLRDLFPLLGEGETDAVNGCGVWLSKVVGKEV